LQRPTVSADNTYLYWLNQSDGKLQRLTLADHQLDSHAAELTEGAVDFCLSRDGATAFVAAAPNGFSLYRADKEQQGTIQVIDTATMAASKSFTIAIDPFEIVCDP